MKYVLLSLLVLSASLHAEVPGDPKIVPVGKKITATEEQITGLFQIIEKRPPTPEQVEKTKEFLERNPLPPRELFFQRRETVDNFFENVLGRDPSKAEMRKTMEFLVEQETIAKVRAEETLKNGSPEGSSADRADGNDRQASGPAGDSLATSELEALKIAAEVGALGTSGTPGKPGDAPASVSPASQVELDEAIAESNRAGHTGSSGFVPPAEPPAPVAVVAPLLPTTVTAPSPTASTTLRAELADVLEQRVNKGEITPEEGQKAMRDILNEFESGRRPAEAAATPSEAKIAPAPIAASSPQELQPSLGTMGPTDPGKVAMPSFMGKWQVTPPPVAPATTPPTAPLVAEEMSKVLNELGKASLSPDGKAESAPTEEASAKLQTAGTGNSAGANDTPSGDNTGLTPALNAKSGAVVGFGKVTGWLNQYVEEYLRRGKNPADKRLLASPHPIGLPKGSLTPREEKKVSFIPEGRGDYLFMAQAAPEAFLKHNPSFRLIFWGLLGVIGLRVVLLLRRKSQDRDEETRKEPKVI